MKEPYDYSVSSVAQSCLTLRHHGLQQARPPCPSPTPGACSNSSLSSRWCHPIISSSVVPFSSCLQSFPASRSFQMNQFFASGGPSILLWNFSGKNTGVGFHFTLQEIFPNQGTVPSLLCLLHWQADSITSSTSPSHPSKLSWCVMPPGKVSKCPSLNKCPSAVSPSPLYTALPITHWHCPRMTW